MRKTTLIKALALLLSFAMLMTGLPAPSIAESVATPTDTVIEQSEEIVIEDEQPIEEAPDEPVVPDEEPELPPVEDEPVTDPAIPAENEEDATFPEDDPLPDDGTGELPADDVAPETETEKPSGDEPVTEDEPLEEQPDETVPDDEIEIPDIPVEDEEPELPPIEDVPLEEDPLPEDDTQDEPIVIENPIKAAIDADGYAYLMAENSFDAFSTPDMAEHIFTVHNGVLLATDFIEYDGWNIIEVQFLTAGGEALTAYAYADDLPDTLLERSVLDEIALTTNFALVFVGDGKVAIFEVDGEAPYVEELPPVELPEEPEPPIEQPNLPDEEELFFEDEPVEEMPLADEGAFVLVSTDTRTFLGVDDSAADDYEGDLYLGYFVSDAIVQVESIEQDALGRSWYLVRYLYGDTHADGTLKWTDTDVIYVLAVETYNTAETELTVTDYAFPYAPMTYALRATPMNGFSLRDISASLGNFYVGQTGLHGSSGKDSEYLQIATLAGYGKIYATPHYLEGYTVYCLEHLLPGPGERSSSGGYQPTGPYTVVDLASYMATPGYSGVMYKESTMHAIGWVLRHTVPFMELDRSDSDNRTWSRVAGQFAIREVIKQLEGAQYVRDYWDMDDFYAASNNAPAVYLEYARWLAANGIARASMTGKITVSNKSVTTSGGMTVGTVTLTTDADLIRVSKSYGRVTGHTYGEDSSYYYLNSGDTITISSSASSFSFKAESMSLPDEEAGFVVGVPYEAIQKLLIPIEGLPYPIKSVTVSFDIPYGSVSVTKTDFNTGRVLAGATFDLISGSTVIQSMTTGADGVVTFTDVPPGTYTIRERTAPEGYMLGSVNVQTVNVSNGQTSRVTFTNEKITARIKIVKKDSLTGDKLAGASFKITRLSGPAVVSGMAIGESITIVTDVNGTIETGWLEWGRYRIEETAAPEGFLLTGYSTEINAYENGKTYSFEVENEPMSGFIQLEKTDRMNSQPIAGVQFNIYDASGDLAGSMTTNDDGIAISPPLRRGDYSVLEHANPTGYVHELVELNATVLSDETTYLEADNQPIQGKIRIVKKDQLTGDLLSGAEFTIIRISGIPAHNGAGNGEVVATITTDANGVAESPLLTYGTYRITEIKAPDHFVLANFTTEVQLEVDEQIIEVMVENEPMMGGVRLTKTDSLTGSPISGVQFDIYDASGTLVVSMTTDANGVATAPSLTKGNYTIRERNNPTGYVADLVELKAEVQSNQTTDLSVVNTPIQGKIRIVKKDQLTDDLLSGAEFTITRISGIPAHNGTGNGEVVVTITTDANGVAESPLLTYGTYRITETKAPDRFVLADFSTDVTISEDNLKTIELVVENEPTKGYIRLTKMDSLNGTPIAGVQFDIYDVSGSLAGTMTTDENGIAVSPALDKGSYTVREHENPTGYVAVLAELPAVVSSDETTDLAVTNDPIQGKIRIVKKDQLTSDLLAGAEFTITRISGIPAHNGAGDGEIVATIITDVNGGAESPLLTYGVYRVTETKAPDHFVLADFSTDVSISEDNLKTIEIVVENEPTKGYIRLTKTDSLSGTPIAGVQFDIYDVSGTLTGTMTTDENGIAVSPALTKGSYTVREHENPTGYLAALAELPAVVHSDETTDLAVTNDPIQGKIRIVKKDQLTGDLLAGAEFTVTRVSGIPAHNGAGNGEEVAVITTNENGVAETPLLTYGTYQIKETVVPEHFVDNGFSVEVTISDDTLKTYEVVVENEPAKGWLKLTKTNSLDGHPIAGVTFNVYYYDDYGNGLACTMTTDENGVAVSPALRKGRYLVQEEDEPVGYVHDLVELTAIVNPDETTELHVSNEPIQGVLRIRKLDELTGEALAGAEFTITRISGLPSHNGEGDGEVVAVITTDANGIAVTPLLPYGVYKVEETKVPAHFVDNDFSTEMVINEENFCTYEIDVENEPAKGWLRLTKTDRENGNPVAGVVFDVYYADQYGQGLATTMVTDANGVAMSEPLRKGQYTVQERGATKGYVFEQVFLEATVHSDEITELTATNQPVLVQLKLYKRDVDEYSGNPADAPGTRGDGVLTGAEFQVLAAEDITDRQGNVIHAKGDVVIASIKTAGADASVTTDKLWPGLYQVVELTPPTGYQPSEKPIIVDARDAAKQSEEAIVTYEGVITNEIMYGAQAIVKLLGDGTAAADPTRVETPEPDAEFRVYLQKVGSYDNARDIERDYLVTDKNGYAMTKALPYGVYVLEQVMGKEGYEIKGPITFEIDGTESLVNPPPLTLSDQPILYRLKFIKTDSETGKVITLSNASFRLKDADGNYVKQKVFYPREQVIEIFTTDETGSVTLPETVTWGLHFVEEVKAPEGYLIRTDSLSVFVGHEGDLPGQTYELEIEIPNDPVMGRILLDKKGLQLTDVKITTDAWGNKVHTPVYEMGYLPGAVFEIRAAEDIIGKDGTVWYQADELVDTITTTANGGDASRELPLGKYNVVEVAAPEGYFFTDRAFLVDLRYRNDHTALVEVRVNAQNDFLPAEISLFKAKETINIVSSGKDGVKSILTDEAGEGFVFGLFTTEDMPYAYGTLMADTLVATGATDKNGMLTLTGTFPHGDYYIRELAAPDGWKITADRFDLSITPDRKAADENVLRVLMVDAIHNELIHTKVTLTKTDITGTKTLPGAVIEVYNEAGKIIYRDTTDEMGRIANIPVTPGRYTFREVYAPDGYALNDVTMSFTVSADGVVTGDTAIRDDYTRFSIEKLDESENPLAGVEFSLIASNGVAIMTARTNREGIATFEKVPFGTYRVVETKPLAGYLPAEMEVEVTIDGTFINPEHPIATIINVPNEIVIRKVDQNGKPLAGATFGLFDAFGERFAVATSDENGMVRFTKVPYGSYTIRELSAPDGYLISREEIAVTIDADYRSSDKPIATVKNHFKRVQFIKVDTSGKYLPGVEFSLINAVTHEVVETAVSNDKGEFIFTKFDYGDWIIRETAAPEGYNRMEDYPLHVDETWTEPKPITLVNIPSTYMFFKSDNRKNALAGATFAVEDENGNMVQEVVSAENGVVYIYGLTPGKYTIRETATVEGFTVNDDTIEVVIDEKYEVPTKLKRFVNYPSISTGVDVSPTTLTWVGIGLVGIAGLIVVLNSVMGGKKYPKRKRK